MSEEMRKLGVVVEQLLKSDERCRNDDKWLCYRVYMQVAEANGLSIFIPFAIWREFPAFESISRCRRKIQHDYGLYPATKDTDEAREEKRAEVKEWAIKE